MAFFFYFPFLSPYLAAPYLSPCPHKSGGHSFMNIYPVTLSLLFLCPISTTPSHIHIYIKIEI